MLFPLGRVVITPGAQEACGDVLLTASLDRHQRGDWGIVHPDDKGKNSDAVVNGGRIFSAYPIDANKACQGFGANTLWIITEADHSITTLLLPDEY